MWFSFLLIPSTEEPLLLELLKSDLSQNKVTLSLYGVLRDTGKKVSQLPHSLHRTSRYNIDIYLEMFFY